MNYEELKEFVYSAPFDVMTEIYRNGDDVLSIFRPTKLSKRFKNYDINKNFQIFLKENDNEFKPNHFRIFIDLKFRVMDYPKRRNLLLKSFDNIFYGMDPIEAVKPIKKYKFKNCLNDINTIAQLAQLFLLEQCEGYSKKSKYDPASLYMQGWIRYFLHEPSTMDFLVKRVSYQNAAPPVKYTKKDDKNHKGFELKVKPLWYL